MSFLVKAIVNSGSIQFSECISSQVDLGYNSCPLDPADFDSLAYAVFPQNFSGISKNVRQTSEHINWVIYDMYIINSKFTKTYGLR